MRLQFSSLPSHIAVDMSLRNPNPCATISFSVQPKVVMFPARLELAAFRVLGGCDNHYTRGTTLFGIE